MNLRHGLRIASIVWAARLLVAWALSRPIFVLLSAGVSDDRFLFEPGALGLLEVLRLRMDLLGSAARATFGLLFLAYVGLACVSIWATRALAAENRLAAHGGSTTLVRLLPRAAGLWLTVLGPAALLALVAGPLAVSLRDGPLNRGSASFRDLGTLGVLLLLGVVVALLGVVHDLARAHLVSHDAKMLESIRRALYVLRSSFWRLTGMRIALALIALAITSGAAALTGALAVERPGDLRAWGALLNHQLAAWLLATLHVVWLGLTLRATHVAAPARADAPGADTPGAGPQA